MNLGVFTLSLGIKNFLITFFSSFFDLLNNKKIVNGAWFLASVRWRKRD